MKRALLSLNFVLCVLVASLFFTSANSFANGVAIVDGSNGIYLQLKSSDVNVDVENQVAILTATQTFRNILDEDVNIKYGFPLSENASSLSLRWNINDEWKSAVIEATPQNTDIPGVGTPGGGGQAPNLKEHLGVTPLFFEIEDTIARGETIIIELVYVELLSYKFGKVTFNYPNKYDLIQNSIMDVQELRFNLVSPRTIESVALLTSQTVTSQTNDGNIANIQSEIFETIANEDYIIEYTLSLDELGLFGLSTLIPASSIPDELGGFFLFVAEPDPSETTDIINKVFTLIIDRSGSMDGEKIIQARNAAEFIVKNLNESDKFNIVDFASEVSSFETAHVDFTEASKQAALAYIQKIVSGGGTNISGAFDTAIPQFSVASDSTANIIIFFTDGEATAGITNTQDLVSHVSNLVTASETNLSLFTFGIGDFVNEQLLTLLATNNDGLAEFLGSDNLEERITEFFLQINNPVLLNTQMEFSFPDIINETFPSPLPNLYKGQQMVVTGRYLEAVNTDIILKGTAFGSPVEFRFSLDLADGPVESNQFLPKIWAKQKIDNLLIKYNGLDKTTEEAEKIKAQVVKISIDYGVISPFTSFSQTETGSTPVPSAIPIATPFPPSTGIPVPAATGTPFPFSNGTPVPAIATPVATSTPPGRPGVALPTPTPTRATVTTTTTTSTTSTTTTTTLPADAVTLSPDFSVDKTEGNAPLEIQFTDLTEGSPIEWLWDFGDGETSRERNPLHTYDNAGVYSVTLEVSNLVETESITKIDLITVKNSLIGKAFTVLCVDDFVSGPKGTDKLLLEINENQNCTLKLSGITPGASVEVSTLQRSGLRSSVEIEPAKGNADLNGELEFTLSGLKRGVDWIAWAIRNDQEEFDFSKKAYEIGTAWGLFVEVK